MAAGATRAVLARGYRMLADEVVRVDLTRTHVAIVTADAEAFLMAVGAKLTVVPCDTLVSLDKVWPVPGVVKPGRRR